MRTRGRVRRPPAHGHLYVVALGSNQRHTNFGAPPSVVAAVVAALNVPPLRVLRAGRPIASRPVGPSQRTYCNSAVCLETPLDPEALLAHLQRLETQFGRIRRGQRWRARVIDLDIILWSGGCWQTDHLTIPHPHFRARSFVLRPMMTVAPDWRDPVTQLNVRHLFHRLDRRRQSA